MNFKSYSCRYDFRKEKFTNDLVERNKRQSRLLKARTNAKLHQGSGAIVLTLESIPFCPINHPHNPFNPSKVRGCSEYCWQLNLSRSGISQHLGENLYQIVRAKQANKVRCLKSQFYLLLLISYDYACLVDKSIKVQLQQTEKDVVRRGLRVTAIINACKWQSYLNQ